MQYLLSSFLFLLICMSVGCKLEHGEDNRRERTYITAHTNDPDRYIYAWQGNIDGQYPVLMWYKEFGDKVAGSLFYTARKNATAIQLSGAKKGKEYELREMLPDGRVIGIWHVQPDAVSMEGTWYDPRQDITLNVSLMHIDTAVTVIAP
ncbi:MAG: hypothetical protein KDC07_06005 [Chitinophagaceae bacterium]|nr:hypothetical protein [Chitinophagaceae bacterium]MCB9046737.1 hypothetical protein [Chitinophagales bacterium]